MKQKEIVKNCILFPAMTAMNNIKVARKTINFKIDLMKFSKNKKRMWRLKKKKCRIILLMNLEKVLKETKLTLRE